MAMRMLALASLVVVFSIQSFRRRTMRPCRALNWFKVFCLRLEASLAVLPPLASLTRSCRAIRRWRYFNRFSSAFDGFGMSMKVPSDEVKVCTQPRSRPMAPSPLLGSGDGVLTNTRLRCVQSTWMLVYGRIGRLVRTWMTMRHLALSPGLRHRDGFMPVMTTTPDFRPVLWNTALWQPLLGVYQQTKPKPRRRDLNPGTRPPEVFFLFNPANHSAFSILLVDANIAEGIPAIQRHEVLAWLSDIRGNILGPPKGSSAQSITSPVTLSLTGVKRGRCSRRWLNLERHPSHSHTMIRSGFLVQHGLPQRSTPRKTLAPSCLTPSMRTFWLIRAITSLIFRLCVPKADLHTPALKGGARFYFRS